jgi:hypothetical protein
MREGGQRMDKAAVVKMIAGVKCDIKTWNLDGHWMAKIDADTYVLSYRSTWDGTCTGTDGSTNSLTTGYGGRIPGRSRVRMRRWRSI